MITLAITPKKYSERNAPLFSSSSHVCLALVPSRKCKVDLEAQNMRDLPTLCLYPQSGSASSHMDFYRRTEFDITLHICYCCMALYHSDFARI